MISRRKLYRFDADEAPSTYITNYLIAAICLLGVLLFLIRKPKPYPAPPNAAFGRFLGPVIPLLIHLGLYGVVMIIGGLGHQVWIHNQCPGVEMPGNVTVPCPDGLNNEPVIRTYLFFLGPAIFQLPPLWISLSGFARPSGPLGSYTTQVAGSNVLGLALGIVGAVLGHSGFIVLGVLLVVFFVVLPIATGVGLRADAGHLVTGKVLVIVGSVISLVGFGVQQGFGSMCGAAAYREDGVSDCPFGGNGITGVNHNAVFHIIDALSKCVLVAATRFLVISDGPTERVVKPGATVVQENV